MDIQAIIDQVMSVVGDAPEKINDILADPKAAIEDITGQALNIISFILIFAVVVTLLFLLGKILEASVKIILLGWLNKLLGLVFALLKYALVIGLLVILFDSINDKFSLVSRSYLDSSFMYSGLKSISYSVFPYLKSLFV